MIGAALNTVWGGYLVLVLLVLMLMALECLSCVFNTECDSKLDGKRKDTVKSQKSKDLKCVLMSNTLLLPVSKVCLIRKAS